MKTRWTKAGLKVTRIFNEGLLETVGDVARAAQCKVEFSNHMTEAIILCSNDDDNERVLAAWNKEA